MPHHGGINGAIWVEQSATFPVLIAAAFLPSLPPLLSCCLTGGLPVSPAPHLLLPLSLSRRRRAERAHRAPAPTRAP